MAIKTFRSKIAADAVHKISLATNDGGMGYRITKFQAMSASPAGNSPEAVIKVYKTPQTAADFAIDFSDNTLIAAMFYEGNNSNNVLSEIITIFDHVIFNQDIYVTCSSTDGEMNYYIELESMSLDLNENTFVTLQDIRNTSTQ